MMKPGELLNKYLQENNMSRKELAIRTGVTEKHISTVISSERPISLAFAHKLGYVFENFEFWLQKQNEYDQEQMKIRELNEINEEEINILKNLKGIIDYLVDKNYISESKDKAQRVLQMREFLKVSNLTTIKNLSYSAAYRAQVNDNLVIDPYVVYAWQRMCEAETENVKLNKDLNVEYLQQNINKIKGLMKLRAQDAVEGLSEIMADCGIAFKVVRNFRGAPVQGFIKKEMDGKLILCLTIRGKRADTFWFTLFHEIGHVINKDYESNFIDFNSVNGEMEERANEFARDNLISPNDYKEFVLNCNDFTWDNIKQFAKKEEIEPFVVLGRLQNDGYLDWTEYSDKVKYYDWA